MIALVLAVLLAQTPSPPLRWTRSDLERRWGAPTSAGPLPLPWGRGSVLAIYQEDPDNLDCLCRAHVATAREVTWAALVYYGPTGQLVAVHCMRIDVLDDGFDVTPDVAKRLRSDRL